MGAGASSLGIGCATGTAAARHALVQPLHTRCAGAPAWIETRARVQRSQNILPQPLQWCLRRRRLNLCVQLLQHGAEASGSHLGAVHCWGGATATPAIVHKSSRFATYPVRIGEHSGPKHVNHCKQGLVLGRLTSWTTLVKPKPIPKTPYSVGSRMNKASSLLE